MTHICIYTPRLEHEDHLCYRCDRHSWWYSRLCGSCTPNGSARAQREGSGANQHLHRVGQAEGRDHGVCGNRREEGLLPMLAIWHFSAVRRQAHGAQQGHRRQRGSSHCLRSQVKRTPITEFLVGASCLAIFSPGFDGVVEDNLGAVRIL